MMRLLALQGLPQLPGDEPSIPVSIALVVAVVIALYLTRRPGDGR